MKTYLVGGAVRDKLMGVEPKDRDWLIVGATEHDVQHLLDQGYQQVGADFPVFLHPLTREEYALARVERKAGVGYHGFEVDSSPTVTVEEDLARRDLTINSMAIDAETGKLVDPYNGQRDLRNGILRNTSPAFAEDPLRILRLARFAARFPKFRICNSTVDLCCDLAKCGELNYLATERIWAEVEKGLCEKQIDVFMRTLYKLQVLEHCTVLRGTFGNVLSHSQEAICRALVAVEPAKRLLVGTATLALRTDAALDGTTKRLADLYEYLFEFRHTNRSALDLAKLLKRTGALRDGPSFSDFCCAVAVMELAGFRRSLSFTSRELKDAAATVREIRATRFPTMEGRALGEAIDTERVQTLHRSFSIPIEVLSM